MSFSDRITAFLAYLFSIVGWIYAIIVGRKSSFVIFHLKQSISIFLFVVEISLGWVIVAWILTWIPLAGVLTSVIMFPLVIAAYFAAVVLLISGMVNALRGKITPLPFVGNLSKRLPLDIFLGVEE